MKILGIIGIALFIVGMLAKRQINQNYPFLVSSLCLCAYAAFGPSRDVVWIVMQMLALLSIVFSLWRER